MDWSALPEGQWVVTFYFGLTRLVFPSVTEAEWSEFVAEIVTPAFPDGFTVFEGAGQFFNPRRRAVIKIATKVLVITASKSDAAAIDRVRGEYERRFNQHSVGLTVVPCHADFAPVPT
jgi:hypothetical protein